MKRKLCLRHRLAAFFGKPSERINRTFVAKANHEPKRVDLVDDDDDLMTLAKALYPEHFQTGGEAR